MPPKKKSNSPAAGEEALLLPTPPTSGKIVDTHAHLVYTFDAYKKKYKDGKHADVFSFVRAMYEGRNVEAVVDVWCEAPIRRTLYKELADSAISPEDRESIWGGVEYWFALGVHPHNAKSYNDDVEKDIEEAIAHPRCVSVGETGLDYHYDNSPRDVQQAVFVRQIKLAVKHGKPLTIHTREAEEDTERLLKEHVPKDHRIHVHCFTDSPEFAKRLLDHFPKLYIGITGVISYATNANTAAVVAQMAKDHPEQPLRILLETDAPYMIPSNIYNDLSGLGRKKLPLSHSAMIPWTAKWVADAVGELWDADLVMLEARENARIVYGV